MDSGKTPAQPYTHSGWLTVAGGVRLHYAFNDRGARGAVLIAPGWIENTLKYRELAAELGGRGHPVFVLDHRCQGLSTRLAGNAHITHVERFEDYVADLAAFHEQIVLPAAPGGVVLLGHSLGGLIGARLAARQPPGLRALILSAPLFEVHGGLFPESVMYWVARLLVALGRGRGYVPGHRDWDATGWRFEGNALTASRERFERWRDTLASQPQYRVGGVSNNWLKEVIESTRAVGDAARSTRVPVLVLQAGRDKLVRPRRQKEFCRLVRGCTFQAFPEARHELLMEADPIRDRVLASVFRFLDDVDADGEREADPVRPPRASDP